jgi:hypothetical protein
MGLMRRPLSLLAPLFVAALLAPTAQGATRQYHFQDFQPAVPGHVAIHLVVVYKNKSPQVRGRRTPQQRAALDEEGPRRGTLISRSLRVKGGARAP